jgi:hypothetical protein
MPFIQNILEYPKQQLSGCRGLSEYRNLPFKAVIRPWLSVLDKSTATAGSGENGMTEHSTTTRCHLPAKAGTQ